MIPLRRPRSLFYGWWLVSAATAIQVLVGGLMFQAFGAYATVLRDEFGFSKTLVSAAFSMSRVESGILGPFQGWLIDRFGPTVIIRVGITFMGLGFIGFSQINSAVTFFLAFFCIAVGSSLAGFMTLTVAIVNWFQRRRATALGLMSAGFAIGGMIVPLVVISFNTIGWRATAFVSGLVILAVGHTLASVIRHRPEDMNLTVDGAPQQEEHREPESVGQGRIEQQPSQRDFTAREALRTPAFWYISLGHGSALLVVSAVMVHMVIHVNENLGYSLTAAGVVVAMMTSFQIIGQLAGGVIGDRANKRAIIVACMAGHAVGLVMLAYAVAFWMVVAFAVLHGLAWGARGPLVQAIRADYFGRSSFGTIMGFSSMIVMVGMTIGPIIAGVIADRTGSYEIGFTVLASLAAIGSLFFVLATPPTLPGERKPAVSPSARLAGAPD